MKIELDDEYVDKIVATNLIETWEYIEGEIKRLDFLSDEQELTENQKQDLEEYQNLKPALEKVMCWYIPYSKCKELDILDSR